MEALFLRVIWISLTCSAVLFPLLLAGRWLRRHVRAKSLYVVWLVLALRLVIPVELTLPEPVMTVEAPELSVVLTTPAPTMTRQDDVSVWEGQTVRPQAEEYRAETPEVPVTVLLAAFWLTGVLGIALIQSTGYFLTRRALLHGARPVEDELEAKVRRTAGRLCLTRFFPVCQSGRIRTPMVLGLVRPVLLLPEGQKVDELILCHELTHLKRRDLLYKALLTAACWLHWFNPLVWRMSRAASENLELCCDDDVTGGRDAAFRRKYGELLLSTAEEKPGPALSSRFGGSKETMKERLANLFVKKKRGRLLVCTALAVLILAGGLVACESRPAITDQEAVDALHESLHWDLDAQAVILSFTIPEGERDWSIRLEGETGLDDAGAIRTFNETAWGPGESYSFRLPMEVLLGGQLSLNVSLGDGAAGFSAGVAAGSLGQENLTYVNREYGFTLTLPDGWADQVEIREGERGLVGFYMKNAGDWEDAGWLAGIFQCTPEEGAENEEDGNPAAWSFLADLGHVVLYAAPSTDLPVDPEIPEALDRYAALSTQVTQLLDSFALTGGGAYTVAQIWLEEQVAAGPPEDARGYDYVDSRIESLEYVTSFEGYDVYRLDYRFLVDYPENVVLAGGMSLDEAGWLRDYPVIAYLMLHNGAFESVKYMDIGPPDTRFWYEWSNLPEDVRWEAAAWAAYQHAYAAEQLYWGTPRRNGERSISQAELEAAGYQVQGDPPDTWWEVDWTEDWAASYNMIWSVFSDYFSDDLTQQRVDGMLTGPNAPYLCYDGALYFRNDVPCGPGVREVYLDWDSYTVTRVIDQPDFEGIEFTLSGSRDEDGAWEDGTWSFRFGRDDPGGLLRFYTWFDET